MSLRSLTLIISWAALLGCVIGCGGSNKPAAGGGVGGGGSSKKNSDPDLSKPMTLEDILAGAPAPRPEKTREDTDDVGLIILALNDSPTMAGPYKQRVKGNPTLFVGTVKSKSPDDAEIPFLILEGGTHFEKTYTAKCNFAPADREAIKKLNPGESIWAEGVTDAEFKDLQIEFKDCVFKTTTPTAGEKSAPAGEGAKPAEEKKSSPPKP